MFSIVILTHKCLSALFCTNGVMSRVHLGDLPWLLNHTSSLCLMSVLGHTHSFLQGCMLLDGRAGAQFIY